MTSRRRFLGKGLLALAGGLLVGDAALEAFDRLTHRKVFALGGLPDPNVVTITLRHWHEIPFTLTDRELLIAMRPAKGFMLQVEARAAASALSKQIDADILALHRGRT